MSIKSEQYAQAEFDQKYRALKGTTQDRLEEIYYALCKEMTDLEKFMDLIHFGQDTYEYQHLINEKTIPNLQIHLFQLANELNVNLDDAIRKRRKSIEASIRSNPEP